MSFLPSNSLWKHLFLALKGESRTDRFLPFPRFQQDLQGDLNHLKMLFWEMLFMIQNEKSDCIHWSHLEHLSQEHKQKGMFKHSATKLFEKKYIYILGCLENCICLVLLYSMELGLMLVKKTWSEQISYIKASEKFCIKILL